LISRLLRHPRLVNTAVIVNEFGEVGLDHALLEPIRGEVVVLAQGCLCCALNGDLSAALEGLDTKRAAGAVPYFDRVIVETTGLADPAPVLQTILDRPMLLRGYRLGRVVTTVDVLTGAATLDRHREAVRQVAIAERLFVTKRDLVGEEQADALRRRVGELNSRAPIWFVSHGEVDPQTVVANEEAFVDIEQPAVLQDLASLGPGHAQRIATISLEFPRPLPYAGLREWLGDLVGAHGEQLLRVKGIVAVQGQDRPIVVHGVQHLFHPPRQLASWPAGLARSTLVFILDGLEPSAIVDSAVSAGLLPNKTISQRGEMTHEHR
jgi:G3E family GTPase